MTEVGNFFFFIKSSLCTYVSATAKNKKDWNKTHRWQERACYSYLPFVGTALSNCIPPTTVSATAKTTSTIVVKNVSLQANSWSKLCLSTREACPPQKKKSALLELWSTSPCWWFCFGSCPASRLTRCVFTCKNLVKSLVCFRKLSLSLRASCSSCG